MWKNALQLVLVCTLALIAVQPASAQLDLGGFLSLGHYTGFDPNHDCWRTITMVQEVIQVQDLEWIDDDCFIARRDICTVTENICSVEPDGTNIVEGNRTVDSCFTVAELICRTPDAGWDPDHPAKVSKEASSVAPFKQVWNVDGEFWETVP
ncbi:MAG: hypothetical protein AAGD38_14400 [Acidobacteriota bacterium]